MSKHRHSQLRAYLPYIWAEESVKDVDPWWMVSNAIHNFNYNRSLVFKPGHVLTMDESMSAFRPRKTATGESTIEYERLINT